MLRLIRLFGLRETVRMLRNVLTARRQTVGSVATATYWSRGAVRWGPTLAVRYLLRPEPGAGPAPRPPADDPDYLSTEAARRLASGDIRFELCVQRYVDEKSTPIENTAVEWTEQVSPAEPVAVLTLARGDLSTADALAQAQIIEKMAFNPWNTTDEFRPLGNLNRARKEVYDASSAQRLGYRFAKRDPGAERSGRRGRTRGVPGGQPVPCRGTGSPCASGCSISRRSGTCCGRGTCSTARSGRPRRRPGRYPRPRTARTSGSSGRSTGPATTCPRPRWARWDRPSGATCRRNYGRNLHDEPSPILVSQQLLHRDTFLPARSLNLLAAAWIQFQVHDWVDHARYPLGQATDVRVPLLPGMTWSNVPGGPPEQEMRIAGNIPFEGPGHNPMSPVFPNATTPWWDGSEVYGSAVDQTNKLRDGAKLRLTPQGYLPDDASGQTITGFNESWWLGLGSMHTLFAREHNVLCDELRSQYPAWGDERVFQTARLIVSALIAKIHTVEWTPAILGTEVIDIGLNTNWSGPPAHDWLTRLGIWLIDSHASVGIPKTMPDHDGVPYSLTEEFITVYRMHPLLPDDYRFVDHRTGAAPGQPRILRHPGHEGRRGTAQLRPGEHPVLVRPVLSRRDHLAQQPALTREVRA